MQIENNKITLEANLSGFNWTEYENVSLKRRQIRRGSLWLNETLDSKILFSNKYLYNTYWINSNKYLYNNLYIYIIRSMIRVISKIINLLLVKWNTKI